jgi:uncharacterized protein
MNRNNVFNNLIHSQISRFAAVSLIILAFSLPSFCETSVIHLAARDGDLRKVDSLLKENPELISLKDSLGQTPLHGAAASCRKKVVELLLAKGADVNDKDNSGQTPLHSATFMGCTDAAELLLAKGVDVNAKANNDWTPLHQAVSAGWKDTVELLLAKGAEINAKDSDGNTALHRAVLLLDRFREDASFPVFSGITVMIETLQVSDKTKKDLLELLLSKKADVNAKNNNGETPLNLAAMNGHKEVVELLRRHGGHE